MNLFTETASLELRAAAFKEHGAVSITDLVPEDVCELIKLIDLHPSEWQVSAGVLNDLNFHERTVAPSTQCDLTYTQVHSHPRRLCELCMQPAFLHRSDGDTQ